MLLIFILGVLLFLLFQLNLSEVLIRTRDLFIQMAGTDKNLVNVKLTRQQVQNELEKMGIQSRDNTGEWFTWMDYNNDG